MRKPISMRTIAIATVESRTSHSARRSMVLPPCLLGGSLVRRRRVEATQKMAQTKPMIRIAQGKPTLSLRSPTMRGKMMPPMLPAVLAKPFAKALRCRNQWLTAARLGVNTIDAVTPPKRLKPRIN